MERIRLASKKDTKLYIYKMYAIGDVALTNIGRETQYFHDLV